LPPSTALGLGIAIVAIFAITIFSYRSLQSRTDTVAKVTASLHTIEQLEGILSTLKDAETGQRGYLLTSDEAYAQPFEQAQARLTGQLEALGRVLDEEDQRRLLADVRGFSQAKMAELQQTIELKRRGNSADALAVVRSNRGKQAMDDLRTTIAKMQAAEWSSLEAHDKERIEAVQFSSFVSWGSSGLLLFCILAAGVNMSRDFRSRERRTWLQSSQVLLAEQLQGEQRLEVLGEHVLDFLAPYLGARVGSLYFSDGSAGFRRFAGYALPAAQRDPEKALLPGDGLLGQVAKSGRLMHVRDVPEEFVHVESSLGEAKVRELVLVPAVYEGVVQAVLELGFFEPLHPADFELLSAAAESIAAAVRSAKDRSRLEDLLEETQRQGEELEAQQEELKVSNEELEEQARVLKESQVHLENSQAELEQTNSQLEEQAQILETQKDDLGRAQTILEERAAELQRSNQYKSEFLANMSHELRTPLNSSLILAKLLADNKDGNLNPEQVRFAETISSAGNDLLALINDILDLSKIEAGKVELQFEELPLGPAISTLVRTLQPVATQKGLQLSSKIDAEVPERLRTDGQRFGQILKNLLANALKFTEAGAVSLNVRRGPERTIDFEVTDTGIGIGAEQHEAIFEAFRQADGSTHRKYGGTGLGLSIARDLARRMGGDIRVSSKRGEGSTFSLSLPMDFDERASLATSPPPPRAVTVMASRPSLTKPVASHSPPSTPELRAASIEDDRERPHDGARVILVVEDDLHFAAILRDLIRELGFLCIVTHTADDGLAAAQRYRPNAVILDMNLPDHSGLGVLDQLKHDSRTRHIPVHVASVDDLAQEARELGAVGYAFKPVKREELVKAIRTLEQKFSQGVRRVLVVEDDERQRDSVRELLSADDVEIVGVSTASNALKALREATYDCIVMDLNLPDLSGYELLEQMATQEDVSFPPVIVYTGRSLTSEEEQRLRRFSKAIIIKDAHSPERLLDEVTLFLHQVEAKLPADRQRMLKEVRKRDAALEGRRILVVEDDVRNVFALSSLLEPKGVQIEIARNGKEALAALAKSLAQPKDKIDLVLMDLMMPEMDGLTCIREIRKLPDWKKLPIIALTAKAMRNDQEQSLAAGANDYIAKPLDVEKLLSLVRVWMPK
jgi:CheY-like chemotaxis protein/signal transduction histidine kinase/CHASE3 domain sensor protein